MQEIINAIITGIVQGLTEFLPVSSSGHIELAKEMLDIQLDEDENLLFTIVLHFATALSTIVVFRKDILEIINGFFKQDKTAVQFVINIVISMIPAALVGYFLEEVFDTYFAGNILFVGCMLLVTAVLLYFADMAKNTQKKVSPKDALIIGIAQAIAILPGISRSGATISTSVLLGVDREKSARFSFLMVIPLIFGAMAKKIVSGDVSFMMSDSAYLVAGFIAAFISGIIACKWMISLVKNAKLRYFSYYCVAVGLSAIIYALMVQ